MDVKDQIVYYLAGPMTGIAEFNFPAFHAAAANLRAMGFEIINPAENFGGDVTLPYDTYINEALRQVNSADAIIRLPGWEDSNGVRKECELATELGRRIYEYEDVLNMGMYL